MQLEKYDTVLRNPSTAFNGKALIFIDVREMESDACELRTSLP